MKKIKNILVLSTLLVNLPAMAFLGGDGSSEAPFEIASCTDLQNMQNDVHAHYILTNDIDCSDTVNWNEGKGFTPIATEYDSSITTQFQGSLDGNYYKIKNLTVNYTDDSLDADRTVAGFGLFGRTYNATIQRLIIENANIVNQSRNAAFGSGILVGRATNTILSDIRVTGNVTAETHLGGIAGSASGGSISNVHADVTLLLGKRWYYDTCWWQRVGGLAGSSSAETINSSANVKVIDACPVVYEGKGIANLGGLFGSFGGNTISQSFAKIDVQLSDVSANTTGGLIGSSQGGGNLTQVGATGSIAVKNANYGVGGLLGWGYAYDLKILNSYSGVVINSEQQNYTVGGLVGASSSTDVNIQNSYAQLQGTSTETNACLVGENSATVLNSVCDTDSKDHRSSDFYLGLGWDFTSVWEINEGLASPALQGFNKNLQM